MSGRSVRWILIALAALVGVWGLTRVLGGEDGRLESAGLDIGGVVDEGTSLLRMRAPAGDTVRLERVGETWRVNGWPADTAEVSRLVEALDTARADELVSRSPGNHARLGVTEDSARLVEVGPPEAPAAAFLLGNPGRGGRFVRAPDAPEVYLLSGPVGQMLVRGADAWRDRLVVAADTSRLRRIVVGSDGEELALTRGEDGWTVGGAAADTARVRDLLGALARLTALRFPPDSVVLAVDFETPEASLEVYDERQPGAGTPVVSLLFVREPGEGGGYLVRRADRPETYVVATWSAERLLPKREEL